MSTNRNIYRRSIAPHSARVMADGGIPTDNVNAAIELLRHFEADKDNIKHFTFPALTGIKTRNSGINRFISKLYSINNPQQESLANDAVQTTSTSQPYLSGNIAPTEKYALKNPNGGSNYLTHPTISFGANDAWIVTTVLNRFGSSLSDTIYGNSSSYTGLYAEANKFAFYYNTAVSVIFSELINKYIGKNIILTFVYNGATLSMYINGIFIESKIITFSFIIKDFLVAHAQAIYSFKGKSHAHIIRSGAPTSAQVLSEYNLIRNFIPEIESVVIGTQTWATSNCEMAATPQGNVIAEMQAAGNVEKLSNTNFATNANWIATGGAWTVGGGTATMVANGSDASIYQTPTITVGKWHKITIIVSSYTSGSLYAIYLGIGNFFPINITSAGTFTYYVYATGSGFVQIKALTFNGSLSLFSCQEIGWSGSQELYDGVYAQTAGTVEQKTYAGVKAAAMWCHYNNDTALGAIYGKLYNWFAVKLLQMDIDYYNAANPTTPWGWRVPAQADFQTLSTYLGGDSVSGGKLKMTGTTYWNSPNTGADNSSGFTALGIGYRFSDGSFQAAVVGFSYLESGRIRVDFNTVTVAISAINQINGYNIRLIKA